MKGSRILIWILVAAHEGILAPLYALLSYQLWSKRHVVSYKKRKLQWLFTQEALILVFLTTVSPFILITSIMPSWRQSAKQVHISTVALAFTLHAEMWVETARVWFLYFQISWSRAHKTRQWTSLIDYNTPDDREAKNGDEVTRKSTLVPRDLLVFGQPAQDSELPTIVSSTVFDRQGSGSFSQELEYAFAAGVLKHKVQASGDSASHAIASSQNSVDFAEFEIKLPDVYENEAVPAVKCSLSTRLNTYEIMGIESPVTSSRVKRVKKTLNASAFVTVIKDIATGAVMSTEDDQSRTDGGSVRGTHSVEDATSSIIDEEEVEGLNNWFIEHYATWGDPRFIQPRLAVMVGSFVLLSSVARILSFGTRWETVGLLASIFHYFLALGCFVVIGLKTPSVDDWLGFKLEVKQLLRINMTAIICVTLLVLMSGAMSETTFQGFTLLITSSLSTLKAYISNVWVIKKLEMDSHLERISMSRDNQEPSVVSMNSFRQATARSLSLGAGSKTPDSPRASSVSKKKSRSSRLVLALLKDKDGISLFMSFLMGELSHESMLSVIEMIQFKKTLTYILDQMTDEKICLEAQGEFVKGCACRTKITRLTFSEFTLPRGVPRSTIVRSIINAGRIYNLLSPEFKATVVYCARKLYQKYLSNASRLEINVSYRSRRVLEAFYKANIDNDESTQPTMEWLHQVSHMFDRTIDDMLSLMTHSANRFSGTPEFTKLNFLFDSM